jgi:hypothetical protein
VGRVKDGEFLVGMLLAVLLLLLSWPVLREPEYTEGYCHALGGDRIARYTCNVNGKVVNV